MSKLKLAVIFGGTNTEHEVSLVSAQGVIQALDPNKYDVIPIKITKDNTWVKVGEISGSFNAVIPQHIVSAEKSIDSIDDILEDHQIDVVFPLLHGPYGEDGTVQGLLELMRLPYIGCGVTGSAVCMDKVIQKNIAQSYDIPVAPYFWLTSDNWQSQKNEIIENIENKFANKYPLFVKPANQGSSVGITMAHSQEELISGIDLASTRDLKIIIEQGIENVREIECGLLGNTSNPKTSVLGEILPDQEFYSYESKYLSGGSKSVIPADIDNTLSKKIQEAAKLAFQVSDCFGLARIDFLLNEKTNEYYLNEINTMPGFTPISMYPKLWEASGVSYSDLLNQLVELALARHQAKTSLNFSR